MSRNKIYTNSDRDSCYQKSAWGWFGYLLGTVSDDIGQFLHNEVNALDAGLFETGDLLLDDGLEGHVRGEETDSHT